MPKHSPSGRIHVSCWRCRWKGGSYDTQEDANRAIPRHIENEKDARGVSASVSRRPLSPS
jgi:hypothetical protein